MGYSELKERGLDGLEALRRKAEVGHPGRIYIWRLI
jgi:hypothetical protein